MSKDHSSKVIKDHGPQGFMFFVAYIGAVIYFIQQASGFWEVVGAFFQAIVWPAYVLYNVLKMLGA